MSLASRIAQGLHKVGIALKSHEWAESGPAGLTPTQGEILAILEARGPQRLSEVAAQLAVTPATASDAVSALAAKGFVVKRKAAGDARALAIGLTARGKQRARRAAQWPGVLAGAVDSLSPGEQEVFHRGLIKMIRTLQDRGQIPVARMCVNCTFFRPGVYPGLPSPHHCDFVGAAFGDGDLRIDCTDFKPAATAEGWQQWLQITR